MFWRGVGVGEEAVISPVTGLELTIGRAIVEAGNLKPIPKVGIADLVVGSVTEMSVHHRGNGRLNVPGALRVLPVSSLPLAGTTLNAAL